MPILNAKNVPLNQLSGTSPDVSGALLDTFQQMTFTTVTKVVTAFQVYETGDDIQFMGNWQPWQPRIVVQEKHGQRRWKWFVCHSTTALGLTPDDCIEYLGTQYRVKGVSDWSLNGYFRYELIEDYTGAGP
jgi:hypothetical protein